ncbi:hypothetical protein [Streptomyces sp. ITFR-16]|uniref:hypothetical protein n=1 Tax=Streptomyces sp. ITFR-16 TaxID=3075198 RepID=UPI00288A45CD|nr:hypothetical protein [Streptomyces sp. ITFR-16]WNI21771.1 hypothetical protein RLT58_07440 [Streptomyces sp. ITFR-16]
MKNRAAKAAFSTLAAFALAGMFGPAAFAENAYIDIYNNGYGSANFKRDGDLLGVCDQKADGFTVKASVQKWYDSTSSWQAVGSESAPSVNDPLGNCNYKTVNVEPDSSVIRLHMWAVRSDGTTVAASVKYSASGHA